MKNTHRTPVYDLSPARIRFAFDVVLLGVFRFFFIEGVRSTGVLRDGKLIARE